MPGQSDTHTRTTVGHDSRAPGLGRAFCYTRRVTTKYRPKTTMTEEKVRAMRAEWDNRKEVPVRQSELAVKYEVKQPTVSMIVNRVIWAGVK